MSLNGKPVISYRIEVTYPFFLDNRWEYFRVAKGPKSGKRRVDQLRWHYRKSRMNPKFRLLKVITQEIYTGL